MEIYCDTEFIDNGKTVTPLSFAMVREDGKEYYAVNQDEGAIIKAARNPWLKENVLSSFPLAHPIDRAYPVWDESHPDFIHTRTTSQMAIEVAAFVRGTINPSIWAWFAAYDFLVYSQLYGKMLDIPMGMPQRFNDVAQEAERLGLKVPNMPGINRHHALDDAREVQWRRRYLKDQEMIRRYDRSEPI